MASDKVRSEFHDLINKARLMRVSRFKGGGQPKQAQQQGAPEQKQDGSQDLAALEAMLTTKG
jgi:hypothetical protein